MPEPPSWNRPIVSPLARCSKCFCRHGDFSISISTPLLFDQLHRVAQSGQVFNSQKSILSKPASSTEYISSLGDYFSPFGSNCRGTSISWSRSGNDDSAAWTEYVWLRLLFLAMSIISLTSLSFLLISANSGVMLKEPGLWS